MTSRPMTSRPADKTAAKTTAQGEAASVFRQFAWNLAGTLAARPAKAPPPPRASRPAGRGK